MGIYLSLLLWFDVLFVFFPFLDGWNLTHLNPLFFLLLISFRLCLVALPTLSLSLLCSVKLNFLFTFTFDPIQQIIVLHRKESYSMVFIFGDSFLICVRLGFTLSFFLLLLFVVRYLILTIITTSFDKK